jgi:hypothetical protein
VKKYTPKSDDTIKRDNKPVPRYVNPVTKKPQDWYVVPKDTKK